MSTTDTPLTKADGFTFECKVHFRTGVRGRKRLAAGRAPRPKPAVHAGVPRVARILALAHRYQALVQSGDVRDYADLARLVGVSRPRMTQIMSLLLLAPDIQEAVLDLPAVLPGAEPFWEEDLRTIAAQAVWARHRAMWGRLTTTGHAATRSRRSA